jgi:hypothetical protein
MGDQEWANRRARWTPPRPKATRGTLSKYIKTVKPASEGCVTEKGRLSMLVNRDYGPALKPVHYRNRLELPSELPTGLRIDRSLGANPQAPSIEKGLLARHGQLGHSAHNVASDETVE